MGSARAPRARPNTTAHSRSLSLKSSSHTDPWKLLRHHDITRQSACCIGTATASPWSNRSFVSLAPRGTDESSSANFMLRNLPRCTSDHGFEQHNLGVTAVPKTKPIEQGDTGIQHPSILMLILLLEYGYVLQRYTGTAQHKYMLLGGATVVNRTKILLEKIATYVGSCAYHYLVWCPLIEYELL